MALRGFLSMAMLASALLGCASQDGQPPAGMLGVTWQWTRLTTPVETIAVEAPEHYTIAFAADGRAALRADCNRGSGPYSVTLERASSYFLKGEALFLELPVDSGTLKFERAE